MAWKKHGTYETPCDAGDARAEVKKIACKGVKTRIEPAKGGRWSLSYECPAPRAPRKRKK